MTITTVGVAGAGQMGAGIAQVAAQSGFHVVLYDIKPEFVERGMDKIRGFLAKDVSKGKLSAADQAATLARMQSTTDLNAFAACHVVIEAIIEDPAIKQRLFADLDAICPAETIFCSNTSSIPIITLASVTKRPDQFAGLHFFNPVPVMNLIEMIPSIATSEATMATLREFGAALGKQIVESKDSGGFIVNRLLLPYLLDAIRVYEHGLASREDIDNAMKLGCNHPMGPLVLSDFIGLDTIALIADVLFEEFRDVRFAAPPLLRRMVQAGWLGKKSGRGFYEYAGK
jgi:3-hydroxybutyryl-CoA dehydrogenase